MDTTRDSTRCPQCGSGDLSAWHPSAACAAVSWYCLCCQHQWGVGPPMSDTTERITLRFDRLTDGTLVAVHQGVAAIVHPPEPRRTIWRRRWTLAGDGFAEFPDAPRPHGVSLVACAEAAEALGVHLGVIVDGYEIAP